MTSERDTGLRPVSLAAAYRLRWKRRKLLWRAFRARRALTPVADRTGRIRAGDLLAVSVVRNELLRLPFFLAHYRAAGVRHFLIVDNASDDGTEALLADAPDVSLWRTRGSYRQSRFGLDWSTWLQIRHAHGHWCLSVDADEILVYPGHEHHDLNDLTARLDAAGRRAFGALMLDLYPRGRIGDAPCRPGLDPAETLGWFDPGPYRTVRQQPGGNLWVQGGVRERVFFQDAPHRSPTLNKIPLVRWNRRWTYVNSTHALLPRALNACYDGPGGSEPSGVLLHSKFLADAVVRARDEKIRAEHFHTPSAFDGYYDRISTSPDLWFSGSVRLQGAAQLQSMGLMSGWSWPETKDRGGSES